jgi:predicted membrane protein
MALPGSDEPASISQDEARQELFGRGPSKVGMEVYEVIAIVLGIAGAAIAFDTIDNWTQWLVLAAIIGTVIGFMIAVSPNRRG